MIRKFWVAMLALGVTLAISLGLTLGAAPGAAMAEDAAVSKINGSIDIAPNEHTGDLSTVNGSIHIRDGAVAGQVKTVNGSLKLESHATALALTTVSGSVDVQDNGRVQGNVHSVNGSLHVSNAADVAGDLTNVSGNIHVEAAHIGGNIDTTAGSMDLGPNARIDGNVVIEKNTSSHFGLDSASPPPLVVVEPGTVVKGKMRFDRPVKLYVSTRATIGPVEGAEVMKFSGDHPPD
jgi:cytoskeletal protein CcmA (bactofilin family)